MITLTRKRALAMRMSALLLDGQPHRDVAEVVGHLTAMQGQDFNAAKWAIATRTSGESLLAKRTAIERAFNDGQIVRSWPLRSTVHVIASQDLGWVQRATNTRFLKMIDQWLERGDFQGLDSQAFDRLQAATIEALQGGRQLTRREIFRLWESEGVAPKTGGGYEFVWALCQRGVTVLGPLGENGDPDLVLADEWIQSPRVLVGDEALHELAQRYFAGHGPATDYDLSWWSGLPVTVVRKAIGGAVAKGTLCECDVDGQTMWATPIQLDAPASTGPLHVLAAFDEHLLGYKDRTLSLDVAHARKAMTVNGIAQPTVVKAGRVVAVWKMRDGSMSTLNGERINQRDLRAAQEQIETARHWLRRTTR